MDLAKFISHYYRTSLTRSLRLFLPKMLWKGNLKLPTLTQYQFAHEKTAVRGERQIEILSFLKRVNRSQDINALRQALPSFSMR